MSKTKVICFANNQGGSGNSTTCANIGYSMSTLGKKVLLIDGDMQMNLTLSFFDDEKSLEFAKNGNNIYTAVLDGKDLTGFIAHTDYEGLDIIPSSTLMSSIELQLFTKMQREQDAPLTPLRNLQGYENGIDYKELSTAMPYMYTDKLETVEFITDYFVIDQVIDWFGMDVKIEKAGDKYKVTVRVSPQAMEYWAMQYLNTVEIISPLSLREKLKENLKNATEKYNK